MKRREMERLRIVVRGGRGGGKGNSYRILEGEPEEQNTLGRPRHRWEVKVKVFLK
jgi:hypothetical protein